MFELSRNAELPPDAHLESGQERMMQQYYEMVSVSENSSDSSERTISFSGYIHHNNRDNVETVSPGLKICAHDKDNSSSSDELKLISGKDACSIVNHVGFWSIGPISNIDEDEDSGLLDVVFIITTFHPSFQVIASDGKHYNDVYDKTKYVNVSDGVYSDDILIDTVDLPAFWIFDTIHQGWKFFNDLGFDHSGNDHVIVLWENNVKAGDYLPNPPRVSNPSILSAHYYPDLKQIRLSGESRNPNADANDPILILHEYGHHIMNIAYSRVNSSNGYDPDEMRCFASHSTYRVFFDENHSSSPRCAWIEGWASFVPLIVNGNPDYYQSEAGFGIDYETGLGTHGTVILWDDESSTNIGVDSAAIEGRVTSVLWDIFDSNIDTVSSNRMGQDIYSTDFDLMWNVFNSNTDSQNIVRPADDISEWWNDWLVLKPDTLTSTLDILKYNRIGDGKGSDTIEIPNITTTIPSWIKTPTGWWANDNTMPDSTYRLSLKYFIDNDIIRIGPTAPPSDPDPTPIPSWIRTTAGFWADGSIDDKTYTNAIEYLVNQGIIQREATSNSLTLNLSDIAPLATTDIVTFDTSFSCQPNCFAPTVAVVNIGDAVVFTNTDDIPHTFTSGNPLDGPSGLWNSGRVAPGDSFSVTLSDGGGYQYYSMVKPWMYGFVTAGIPSENNPPTAFAGDDGTVDEGDTVSLSGAGSDPEGGTISYTWRQIDGPTVLLSGASFPGSTSHLQSPSFIAPNVPADDVLTFEITVRDNILQSAFDRVSINVNNVNTNPSNIPPTADAGDDITSNEGVNVFLDGTKSADTDGVTMSFNWKQISGPLVQIFGTEFPGDSSTAQSPFFTAPEVDISGKDLVFKLTVRDDSNEIDIDYVNVHINDVVLQSTNMPPKSKSGSDQIIDEGSLVILDGRKSSDPDGDSITYSWKQTDDTRINIALSSYTSAVTSFVAPLVDSDVSLTFQLTVSDGMDSATDSVDVTISDVSSQSTLPLIQNPFPDTNDNFGYAVSGTNDDIIIVGTPFEDLVEFPTLGASPALSDVISKSIFSFRTDSQNGMAYLSDMKSPDSRFTIKSFKVSVEDNDLQSLHLNHNDNFLSLADNSDNIITAIHDTVEQSLAMSQGYTTHNDIIAFTNVQTNSTVLFHGTSGLPLAQVAQNAGAVYLFDGTTGALVSAIPNPQAGSSDEFGYSIAPYADSGFVIGAKQADIGGTNAGAAYVYDSNADATPNILTAAAPDRSDEFGYAVSADGDIVAVGSPEAAGGGTITIFDGMTGSRLHTIQNPTGKYGDDFGKSVAINDDSIIVGAPFDDVTSNSAGTVYLFDKSTYSQTAQLTHDSHAPFSYFGRSLTATDNIIAVGATGTINSGVQSGSVYLFDGTGSHIGVIPNPAPVNGERFGESVYLSADGKFLMVGNTRANHSDATSAGNVSIYNSTSFSHLVNIENPTPSSGDSFGNSVYIASKENSPHLFVIGSPNDQNDSQVNTGSAYVFAEYDIFEQNQTPIAFAGADKMVTEGKIVILDGTGSVDPDGDDLTYFWNQTSGVPVTLNNTNQTSQIQFTSPDVTIPSELIFELVVSDVQSSSAPDGITITVTDPHYNESPVLSIPSNVTLAEGAFLDVPVSSHDADGDRIIITTSNNIPNFASFTDYTSR
jgi:plastocyanin